MDDILVSGGLAGLLGAGIRLVFTWVTYALRLQRLSLSHVYSLLFFRTITPGGMLIGTLGFIFGWTLLGVVLSQLLAWYGFRYWWVKGPGLVAVSWPFMYLASLNQYLSPSGGPSPANAITSLTISIIAGLASAALLNRYARWPGRADLLPGPAGPR